MTTQRQKERDAVIEALEFRLEYGDHLDELRALPRCSDVQRRTTYVSALMRARVERLRAARRQS